MIFKLFLCQLAIILAFAQDLQIFEQEDAAVGDATEPATDDSAEPGATDEAAEPVEEEPAHIRHKIKSLPYIGEPTEESFSGLIDISQDENVIKKLSYFFVKSQNNPETDPLVLWSNGGPGCSSLFGAFGEIGPWIFPDHPQDGVSRLPPTRNEYSWNRNASLLFVEQPAGVGFSTCVNRTRLYMEGQQDCTEYNNQLSADDFHRGLMKWFDMYPDFKSNEFFMSGESYAGIYIPMTLYNIHNHNEKYKDDDTVHKPNLKGMLIVNGVTNRHYDGFIGSMEFAYSHFLISEEVYNEYKNSDCQWHLFGSDGFDETPGAAACYQIWLKYYYTYKGNYNPYDIYGKCYREDDGLTSLDGLYGVSNVEGENKYYPKFEKLEDMDPVVNLEQVRKLFKQSLKKGEISQEEFDLTMLEDEFMRQRYSTCTHCQPLIDYLNREDVRKAMHIPRETPFWINCRHSVTRNYHKDAIGSQYVWEELKGKYKMIMVSGDTDQVLPTWGSYGWMQASGRKIIEKWRPYYVDDQLAGFTIKYDGMSLATVKGAGHMVPLFKPKQAYHLFSKWINDEKF